ncbi:MAG: hypothetical protein ACI9YU_001227 [Flavobacteriales bacterium]|jgi:hypothetical protein
MNLKSLRTIFIAFSFLGTLFIGCFFVADNFQSQAELCKQGVTSYTNQHYQGKVTDTFIDSHNHLYKTVVVRSENRDSSFYFNADTAGIFRYLLIGDSVKKNSGELFVSIHRSGLDTITDYKFRCY